MDMTWLYLLTKQMPSLSVDQTLIKQNFNHNLTNLTDQLLLTTFFLDII